MYKSSFPEPFSIKLGTKYPWMKMIQFYGFFFSNERSRSSQSGYNCKIVKRHYWKLFEDFFSSNIGTFSMKLGTKHKIHFYAPLCRPSLVRSISFDPFTWSIPSLVQGLPSMSRWSLLIFRSHVQRSRSNHSFGPSVLSTLFTFIPCLLALDRFRFYREDKPEFVPWGAYIFLNHILFYIHIHVQVM